MKDKNESQILIEEITKMLPAASFAVLEFVYSFLLRWGCAA